MGLSIVPLNSLILRQRDAVIPATSEDSRFHRQSMLHCLACPMKHDLSAWKLCRVLGLKGRYGRPSSFSGRAYPGYQSLPSKTLFCCFAMNFLTLGSISMESREIGQKETLHCSYLDRSLFCLNQVGSFF
jgi:hypothetical protein